MSELSPQAEARDMELATTMVCSGCPCDHLRVLPPVRIASDEQEPLEGYSIPFTYTYDQFVVFFYGSSVYLSGKELPIGQCCVDMMNLEDAVLDEIDRRVGEFIPLAWALLTEKTDSAAVLAQEELNAVWDVVFTLPSYRDLKKEYRRAYNRLKQKKLRGKISADEWNVAVTQELLAWTEKGKLDEGELKKHLGML